MDQHRVPHHSAARHRVHVCSHVLPQCCKGARTALAEVRPVVDLQVESAVQRRRHKANHVRRNRMMKLSKTTTVACASEARPTRRNATASVASGRRQAMLSAGASAVVLLQSTRREALADAAPRGFKPVKDTADGYAFLYPVGWQEVSVTGEDVVYKDVIEPLESVSVNIIPTEQSSVRDLGTKEQVAEAMVQKVLTPPGQKSKVLDVKEKQDSNGKTYYTFEYASQGPTYIRRALTTVAISNGKFYTLTTGANDRRWNKMESRLKTVADSFNLLY